MCSSKHEQYCDDKEGTWGGDEHNKGGFAERYVCDYRYVFRMPNNLDLAAASPLLCAGVTVYSPLKYAGVKKGSHVGVVGLGGLGHMAVIFAKAMGAHCTVFSTSAAKKEEALNTFHADHFVVVGDKEAMKALKQTFDLIIDTVSEVHDLDQYFPLYRVDGKHCLVGAPPINNKYQIHPFPLIVKRLSIFGSNTGGIQETQEMLDFAGAHNITCKVEIQPIHNINECMARLKKGDVRYRFVLDIKAALEKQPVNPLKRPHSDA